MTLDANQCRLRSFRERQLNDCSHPLYLCRADYWKSNPRKFCDVCKCWFGDNKVSIEFHESGRRHQENVKKKLEQARKRSAENEKEKLNIAKTISAIEHAALSAYQNDLAGGKAKKAKKPAVISPEVEREQQIQQFLAMDQEELEREMEKKVIEEKVQQKIIEIQDKALESAYQAYSTSYVHSVSWQQCFTPEGYVYYYNSATGVTQWEIPAEFRVPIVPPHAPRLPLPPPPPPASTSAKTTTTTTDNSLKRPSDKAAVESRSTHQPAKRRNPYGEWSTVAVIEREEETEEVEEEGETVSDNVSKEGKSDETGRGIQFEEKKILGGLSDGDLKGDFKGFTFKKRANKGRPQIRQRTSDF